MGRESRSTSTSLPTDPVTAQRTLDPSLEFSLFLPILFDTLYHGTRRSTIGWLDYIYHFNVYFAIKAAQQRRFGAAILVGVQQKKRGLVRENGLGVRSGDDHDF